MWRGLWWDEGSLYSVWWNSAKKEHLVAGKRGEQYFPDIPLKDTWLGDCIHDHTLTSFVPIMDHARASAFSLQKAEAAGLHLDTRRPKRSSAESIAFVERVKKTKLWVANGLPAYRLGMPLFKRRRI
jgi:hypothetical protein